jgi:hypothetical protein
MSGRRRLAVINFRTWAIAASVLGSAVFASPTLSYAIPQAAPMKIGAASTGNLVEINYRHYCRHRCPDLYPRVRHVHRVQRVHHVRRVHIAHRIHRVHRYRRYSEFLWSYENCPPYYGYYMPYFGNQSYCPVDRPCKSRYRPLIRLVTSRGVVFVR